MCFSAPASFAAAVLLAGTGVAALWRAPRRTALFAAVPLLFAAQQAIEGLVWLDLAAGHDPAVAAQAYTFFARVLWPAWIPLAALALEPDRRRRLLQWGLAIVGLFLAAWFLLVLLLRPVEASVGGAHIVYRFRNAFPGPAAAAYLLATCGSLLASSHPWVRAFGGTTLAAAALTYALVPASFASVWCYVAALLSLLVLLHVRPWRAPAAAPARA
jgi:hypothetical protein